MALFGNHLLLSLLYVKDAIKRYSKNTSRLIYVLWEVIRNDICFNYIFSITINLVWVQNSIHLLTFELWFINVAMLAYKTVPGTKAFKKLVHLVLQFLAFLLAIIGVWAAWKFHIDKGIDNFYSLHSWLGLLCLFLFTLQVPAKTSIPPFAFVLWLEVENGLSELISVRGSIRVLNHLIWFWSVQSGHIWV